MPFSKPARGARFRYVLILSGALALFSSRGMAQDYVFSPGCEQAFNAVLHYRLAEAAILLDQEQRSDPSNLLPIYVGNYIDFLILFTGEEKEYFRKSSGRRDQRLNALAKGDRSSPYYRFCLADVNIQWAMARMKFREYAAAGLELKRANDLVKENNRLHPDFLPGKLELGVMHALAGVVPENYRWLASLVGLDGDLEQGVREIETVAGYNGDDRFTKAMKVQATIFASLIQVTLRNDQEAALDMIGRFDRDPDLIPFRNSPLVVYARTSICLKTGHNEGALASMASCNRGDGVERLVFLDYLEGIARLNDLSPDAAAPFRSFLDHFRGSNYIKASWQKLAWISLITGDTSGYRRNIAMARTSGSREVDEDKQAYTEAETGMIPNVQLLKARLLFDGGYYERALTTLLNLSLKEYIHTRRDLAEYYYRLGRIYQSMGQDERALQNYRMAVRTGRDLPQYYAAGALLQMGMIHEHRKEFSVADSCFRLCANLDFEEYKTSLGQKAKAGMNRVSKEMR